MVVIIEEIQQIQRQTEELYLNSKESEFALLKSSQGSEHPGKEE